MGTPTFKILRAADNAVVAVGRASEAALKFALRLVKVLLGLSIWLVGAAVVLAIGALIAAGVAQLPISLAVIAGALIIGFAIKHR